jgi:hypothetical protein
MQVQVHVTCNIMLHLQLRPASTQPTIDDRRSEKPELEITREIRQASSPTMRGHFGCIFKDTEEYTTEVWWAFYMRIMGT